MKFTQKIHMVNLINFLLGQQPLKSLYCTSSSELDLGSHNEKKMLLAMEGFFVVVQIRGKADKQGKMCPA